MEGYNRYDKYKIARDKAWDALINSGITELPVNLKKVAGAYGIYVYSYKSAVNHGLIDRKEAAGDRFSKVIDNRKYIFVSNVKTDGEVRFDIASEIGHFMLGHKICGRPQARKKFGRNDYEAYIFARDLLMPAVVLHGLGITSADKIQQLCNVSKELAQKRADRMRELSERNKFNVHPSERKIGEQFEKFIHKYNE